MLNETIIDGERAKTECDTTIRLCEDLMAAFPANPEIESWVERTLLDAKKRLTEVESFLTVMGAPVT